MNIWYWIIGGIAGWILGNIAKRVGLGNSPKEDTMWAIIMWFIVTITCYAILTLNF
jgi:hypothetical protein